MINNTAPSFNRNISFKGYDARKGMGLLINHKYFGIYDELKPISYKENFKLYYSRTDSLEENIWDDTWTQDNLGIVNGTLLSKSKRVVEHLSSLLHLPQNKTQERIHKQINITALEELIYALETFKPLSKEQLSIFNIDSKKIKTSTKTREKKIKRLNNTVMKAHPAGGNYFITRGKNGEDELLVGKDLLAKIPLEHLKEMFSIQKIIPVPQMDFHLDLFIRPLDKKRVLIADDKLMLQTIDTAIGKVKEKLSQPLFALIHPIKTAHLKKMMQRLAELRANFAEAIKANQYAKQKKVEETLKKEGYQIIRVPGRLYELDEEKKLSHDINFMNANVLVNDKDELVYITNNTSIDEEIGLTQTYKKMLDFGFKEEFERYLAPFVKKEHIYYIKGEDNLLPKELLKLNYGGIHCLCTEVPKVNQKT